MDGAFISRDVGVSWTDVGPESPRLSPDRRPTGVQIAFSPAFRDDETIATAEETSLSVTRDAGRTWDSVDFGNGAVVEAVAVSPDYANDRLVLVSVRGRGLLRSGDGGETFRPVSSGPSESGLVVADYSNPTAAAIQLSPTYVHDGTIFAFAQHAILRSEDGGEHWELLKLPDSSAIALSLSEESELDVSRLIESTWVYGLAVAAGAVALIIYRRRRSA